MQRLLRVLEDVCDGETAVPCIKTFLLELILHSHLELFHSHADLIDLVDVSIQLLTFVGQLSKDEGLQRYVLHDGLSRLEGQLLP